MPVPKMFTSACARWRESFSRLRERCSRLSCLRRTRSAPPNPSAPIETKSPPPEIKKSERILRKSRRISPPVSTAPESVLPTVPEVSMVAEDSAVPPAPGVPVLPTAPKVASPRKVSAIPKAAPPTSPPNPKVPRSRAPSPLFPATPKNKAPKVSKVPPPPTVSEVPVTPVLLTSPSPATSLPRTPDSSAPTTSSMNSPSSESLETLETPSTRRSPHRRRPRASKCVSKCSEMSRLNVDNSSQSQCQRKRVRIEFCQHGVHCRTPKPQGPPREYFSKTRKSIQGFRNDTCMYFKKARERYDSM